MSVRQYIGARYVPLIMGAWDGSQTYEPLSVVLNEGNSYTSKQAVPAGVAITNTDYWSLTGNYNAQVESYRQEVTTLAGQVGDAVDTANEARAIVGEGFTEENTVADALDGVEADINGLAAILPGTDFTSENTVKDYVDGAVSSGTAALSGLIGNGFTAASTVTDFKNQTEAEFANVAESIQLRGSWQGANVLGVLDSWGDESGSYGYSKNWLHIACDCLGANYIDLSEAGSGFVETLNSTFAQRLNAWATNPSNDPDTINIIVVSGGVNDRTTAGTTLISAIATFVETANALFPNALVYMVPQIAGADIAKCSTADTTRNRWTFPARAMQMAYAYSAPRRAVLFNDIQYCLNMRTDAVMNADCIHPTQLGQNVIAKTFVNSICGNDVVESYTVSSGMQLSSGPDGVKIPLDFGMATVVKHPEFIEIGLVTYETTFGYSDASVVPYVWIPNVLPVNIPADVGTCFIRAYGTGTIHLGYCSLVKNDKTFSPNQTTEPLLGIGLNVTDRSSMVGATGFMTMATVIIPTMTNIQLTA